MSGRIRGKNEYIKKQSSDGLTSHALCHLSDVFQKNKKQDFGSCYELAVYEEHALTRGSSSKAAAYAGIGDPI